MRYKVHSFRKIVKFSVVLIQSSTVLLSKFAKLNCRSFNDLHNSKKWPGVTMFWFEISLSMAEVSPGVFLFSSLSSPRRTCSLSKRMFGSEHRNTKSILSPVIIPSTLVNLKSYRQYISRKTTCSIKSIFHSIFFRLPIFRSYWHRFRIKRLWKN